MKTCRIQLLPVLALAVLLPQSRAETKTITRRIDVDEPHRIVIRGEMTNGEKEPVTFLGVETAPVTRTLSTQLGLAKDVGLVVLSVIDKSPASEALKEDDILTKLDDQILIDTHQFSVLVRSKKSGDEVNLTFVRGGKESSIKVKLGSHEVPKQANAFFFRTGDGSSAGSMIPMPPEGGQGAVHWKEQLPGMGADESRDVLRMIDRERGNFLVGPGVHIIGRAGKGSTIVDLPKSNISFADDEGSVEIKVDDGKRNVTVKNAKGEVIFNGPINTPEERAKLPPEVSRQLGKIESDTFNFEVGKDFHPETVPLPLEPSGTKISRRVDRAAGRSASHDLRTD